MKKTKKTDKLFWFFVFAFLILILIPFCFKDKSYFYQLKKDTVSYLSYNDLVNLTKPLDSNSSLYFKLQKQLNTPYIINKFPFSPFSGKSLLHPYLRIAQWNIERGFNIDAIKLILNDKHIYHYRYKNNLPSNLHNELKRELEDLSKSDIISLNEVDIGMPRTKYKNVISEIANSLSYNYAFATEFVELNPIVYKEGINPGKYLGLHGTAVLSRYPIKSARILRLPQYYDWYGTEIQKKSLLENARRLGAKGAFSQNIIGSEIRRGGRTALITEIELPNKEIITVVSTHLEDRCYPDRRFKQFEFLLSNLRNVRGPLVLTGDFNTTSTDSAPTSVKKEVVKRIRDPHFLARQAILAVVPLGFPGVANLVSFGVSKLIQYKDPTAPSIPVIFPNLERKFFTYLKDFRFNDGEVFDTSGDRSFNGKGGLLASSNERDLKGFESTFKFVEPRAVAYFKLDWFFIKPNGNRFRPFNGQTLQLINNAYPNRVSDHEPIIVNLSL